MAFSDLSYDSLSIKQSREKGKNKNPFAGKTSEGEFDHLKGRLALAELRSATSGLQTVLLLLANPKTLVYQGFSASLSLFNP